MGDKVGDNNYTFSKSSGVLEVDTSQYASTVYLYSPYEKTPKGDHVVIRRKAVDSQTVPNTLAVTTAEVDATIDRKFKIITVSREVCLWTNGRDWYTSDPDN